MKYLSILMLPIFLVGSYTLKAHVLKINSAYPEILYATNLNHKAAEWTYENKNPYHPLKPVLFNSLIDTSHIPGTYIYVSDAGNFNKPPWQILKYDENGQNSKVFISEDQGLDWPQDIVFLEDSVRRFNKA